jgi:cysteinyl-tRNA synthetase
MSKSLGNFFTVHSLLKKYNGETIRMALLMSHYSSPTNFGESVLIQAKNLLTRWYMAIKSIKFIDGFNTISSDILEPLLDNLNTPQAISAVCAIIDDLNKKFDNYKANTLVHSTRELLGILTKTPTEWLHNIDLSMVEEIENLIEERMQAKNRAEYSLADSIRKKLLEKGVILEDTNNGTTWRRI